MLTWKIQVSVTLLITDAFVNFLAVHNTKHLKFRVQKFESHLVYRTTSLIRDIYCGHEVLFQDLSP